MKVKIINKSGFDLPKYETEGAAGFDLRVSKTVVQNLTIPPQDRLLIPTGLYVAVPKGYEIQIRPRSGLAISRGITVLNSPGTIDSDYRGEIKVIIKNTTSIPFFIKPGEKIAQGVLCPIEQAEWEEVDKLDETERGEGGFGHTGRN